MHAAAFAIKRSHLRILHTSRACVRRFGLTPARYDMLYAIFTQQASLQRQLWQLFDVSRATVSRMLIALEKLGLVRRSSLAGSRLVRLTNAGEQLMAEAVLGCHRPMIRLFERLCAPRRRRRDRVVDVAHLEEWMSSVAAFFGDRARLYYWYGHPDD